MRSEKQKEAEAKYAQSKKGKITCVRRDLKYQQSEKYEIKERHYQQSEKGKIADARKHAKRKELGFEMINDWFPGSNGHHIDKENVLFIPAELHNSISHSQNDLGSMQRMNDAAFEWFYIEEVI